MDMVKYFLLAFLRWFLKTVNIVSEQRGVHAYPTSKLSNVYLLVSEEETL